MATASHAQAVKSLNKSPGGRRFVFKSLSQRIVEIEIDVYRSLDKVKSQPSEGSSFFRDCLVEWRELNTAEDFISFYEKMMPLVQTLPLILLHKESIFSELLSRLQMKARLSLEPILRLIAALSRDLLEDFIFFLPKIVDSFSFLLENGADREPEIIEQIFTSWSYILMYLQKYLVKDVVHVLKVTEKLRYYPKVYVQEFMAAATSFLLRSAPNEQLKKGIRKIMFEVVKKPLLVRKPGVSGLLYHTMRGTPSRFHSRADRVLQLLTESSIFTIGDKFDQGVDVIIEVITSAFQRECEDMEPKELAMLWNCLYQKIEKALNDDYRHLSCLLSLLISTVSIHDGAKVSDYQPMIELVRSIVQKFVVSSSIVVAEDNSEVIDKVLRLMLCILDGLKSFNDTSSISCCSFHWAPVFALRNSSCLTFIRELLAKDTCIVHAFRVNILSAMNDLMETSQKEVVCLLMSFCERLQEDPLGSGFLDGTSEEGLSRIRGFLKGTMCSWVGMINNITLGNPSCTVISKDELALLWGVICCYPYMMDIREKPSLLMDFIDALDGLLMIGDESIAGVSKRTWQSLLGAALNSYFKCGKEESGLEETSKILYLARTYKSSSHILSAIADCLDSVHGPTMEAYRNHISYHPELARNKAVDALGIFANNLCNSDKEIRVSTLRILCHYQYLDSEISAEDRRPEKRMKTEVAQTHPADISSMDVLHLLLSIEATPLSISTSRKVILLISKMQMGLSAGRISKTYIPIVLSGIIGIFHNRFSYLWNPASECLAVLIGENATLVWDKFVHYFEKCLSVFQSSHDKLDGENTELPYKSNELIDRFNSFAVPESDSTPHATVLSSLLQTLQKIPSIAEAHSRQIVPLFLKYLGYENDDLHSVGSFNSDSCNGKEWRGVLKEWLNLFRLMRNPKAFYWSQFLKDVLLIRLMDENDAEIQMRVLDCLLTWKDDFLLPYEGHLRNLISSKHLREELTTWSLSRESLLIEESHRANLLPLIIFLLIPKVRKPKTLASRKHTSAHHRKAVLRFIAELDVNEISLFFALLIKPLHIISNGANSTMGMFWSLPKNSTVELQPLNILKYFTLENIMALSWKKKYGFLHVIEDILGVFDESHIRPFLDLLMGCVIRMLKSCTSSLDVAKATGTEGHSSVNVQLHKDDSAAVNKSLTSTALKQLRDLRSLCLKIVSVVLNKYDDHDFGCDLWDMFFASVKSLVDGFKQEGCSSEKPSSLFSCFLAMSSSHHLVPLLSREMNLVPDIFSILTVTTASEAIRSCVLKFIDNLLNLDEELDEDNKVKDVLLPNLDQLISSLHCFFQGNRATKSYTGKLAKYPEEIHIRMFKMLSKYIRDQLQSNKFLDVLLPSLAKRSKDSGASVECLQVIRDIIPVLGNESTAKILNAISPLLISVELDTRLNICGLLDALAKIDPSVLFVAKLIRELNATSTVEMGGLDYDTIVNAYAKIDVELFYCLQEDHALVVLSHCVYDMSSEELILRHSAYRSLLTFVEFSAVILGVEAKSHSGTPQVITAKSKCSWTTTCLQRLMNKFFLKHMGNAMREGSSVRKEWIELLRDMVLKLPEVENLSYLKALCSADAEQDFFNNIIHLQKHRRAKALSRFSNVINKSNMSEGIMNKVFVPLFFKMLLDVQGGKGENIKSACLEALASIASQMKWKSYYALLTRCFHEMKMNLDKQKVLLRLVCSMLDQFHFSQNSSCEFGTDIMETGSLATLRKCDSNSVVAAEIQACLHKTVLPMMQKLLDFDSDKVNVNVNVAVLKVLKLLPGDIMDSQLPSIIHRIANHLKNRMESIRDEARLALAACLKELGLEYLKFIVGALRATLKRGYELHVLGYTLNFILSKFLSSPICGKLDYCLEDLLSVVENDILGDVGEEKDVEKIASKMKETRKLKSFDTLKIIAQSITFKSHGLKLLSPIKSYMQKHLTPKVKAKLETMLNQIAAGIECNPSVDQTNLFIFIYGFVEDGVIEEIGQGENPSGTELIPYSRHNVLKKTVSSTQVVGTKSGCSHLITVFALDLFHNRMKSVKLAKENAELLSMLDPFVKLFGSCLSSRYEDILSSSLRCLTPLLRLPLPSLVSQADKIKVTLLDIAQSSVNANNSLMQSCLKMLTVLLRSTKITLSSDQLRLLIQFPLFVDLESNPSFITLALLKAVVSRKLVVPEIYDVMIRIAELIVRSQVDSIRKKCSQISLQFLLDYHLSETYLQQHLDFLLKNLSYEYSTGREAVLEMLHAIIIKFPRNFLDKHAQTIFIHLVQCLVNDNDSKVRAMAATVIKLLIGRVSPHLLDSMLDFSLSWYVDEKRRLQSTGAQALGLLVEVMTKSFQKHISSILPVSRTILQASAHVVADRPSLDLSVEVVPLWKEAYFSLVLLEKILHHFQHLSFKRDLEDIWEAVSELLLHPHPWLRNISSRLVAFYFATATKTSRENHEKPLGHFLLMRPHRLFIIAASLCYQLKTQVIDDAAENLITQNLVFTVCAIHSLMGKAECPEPYVFWTGLEPHEQGLFLKAFQLLESRKGKHVFLNVVSGVRDQDDKDQPENLQYLLVSNLIKEMGKIALQMEAIQMRIIFNSFGKISLQIKDDGLQRYAFDMVLPFYKVCEGFAGKVISDDLKQLAQEVCESMRNTLGIQNFVQVYSEIRKSIKVKRDKRKKEEKVMAVVNPMRNAKRKLRNAAKHRAHKKRKIMTMKMGRWRR
ncbi:small subunit processome component 20 homolog [Ricinus communis]|uniref:small subunit processome component 20 homolog n=1 Tax=Ricinus communis TaxID=3988 RepID=UPI00201A83B6|nr:small subunit processome component 20 homolog [Ricinus communis]